MSVRCVFLVTRRLDLGAAVLEKAQVSLNVVDHHPRTLVLRRIGHLYTSAIV